MRARKAKTIALRGKASLQFWIGRFQRRDRERPDGVTKEEDRQGVVESGKTKVVRKVRIENALGLHARPCALFVQTANRFPQCRITVTNERERINGKSIMGMMTLAAARGMELTIEIAGEEAEQAMEALSRLIAGKFDEE